MRVRNECTITYLYVIIAIIITNAFAYTLRSAKQRIQEMEVS